jgi:hypothetical protein
MAEPIVLTGLRPYYGRIAVLESIVDEVARPSGLVVPFEMDPNVKRGVISHVDYVDDSEAEEYVKERLAPGVVVYYMGGVSISDITFVQSSEIIAYEEVE